MDAAYPRVQELNNFVQVAVHKANINHLHDSFFEPFNIIMLSGGTEEQIIRIDIMIRNQTSEAKKACFWSDSFGDEGIFYSDFGNEFQYLPDPPTGNNENNNNNNSNNTIVPKTNELKTVQFPSFQQLLSIPLKEIPTSKFAPLSRILIHSRLIHSYRAYLQRLSETEKPITLSSYFNSHYLPNILQLTLLELCQRIPDAKDEIIWERDLQILSIIQSGSVLVNSILGSFLSQEVIKFLTRTGKPGNNIFFYDGQTFSVRTFAIEMINASL